MMFDASEVHKLVADLEKAPAKILAETGKVVSKGALNIKKDWQSRWQGLSHAPALASSISYDLRLRGVSLSAEIGPDKSRRQGALGNLLEFGSVNNAPQPGGLPALAAEEPKFVKAIEDVAGGAL